MRRDRTNVPRRFFLSDARGASAIEFAVILPPLILMAIAIVDLGQGINRNMEVQNAAQMGAQYAVTNGNDTTAITTVVTESTYFDGIQASPAPYQFCGCASGTSVAEISCDFRMRRRNAARKLYHRIGARCVQHDHPVSAAALQFHVNGPIDRSLAMRRVRIATDQTGVSAIEFALTLPAFALALFAVIDGGLMMWTQLGIQNGVEKAARCASVNSTLCADEDQVKAYAAENSYGLNPPTSAFTVTAQACGNEVAANLPYEFVTDIFQISSITLSARSCFPSS